MQGELEVSRAFGDAAYRSVGLVSDLEFAAPHRVGPGACNWPGQRLVHAVLIPMRTISRACSPLRQAAACLLTPCWHGVVDARPGVAGNLVAICLPDYRLLSSAADSSLLPASGGISEWLPLPTRALAPVCQQVIQRPEHLLTHAHISMALADVLFPMPQQPTVSCCWRLTACWSACRLPTRARTPWPRPRAPPSLR